MRILIRHVEELRGTRRTSESTLDAQNLSIGRGADQDLNLPDMRVALNRARIQWRNGTPWIQSQTDEALWIDGQPLLDAPLSPGRQIEVGRFRLTIAREADVDLAVEVETRYRESDVHEQYKRRLRTRIEDAGLRLRPIAWALFIGILLVGLLLPAYQRFAPDARAAGVIGTPTMPVTLDQMWVSGPVSDSHAHFGDDCGSCHVSPFHRVGTTQCLDCHEATLGHGVEDSWMNSSPESQCTDCHVEHRESGELTVTDTRLCTDCHAKIDEPHHRVTGFGHEHPPILQTDPNSDAPTPGTTGLLFPHDVHLDEAGLQGPDGDEILACADCHVPDSAGGFKAVTMENDCQRCHGLGTRSGGRSIDVPHVELAALATHLERAFAADALAQSQAADDARARPEIGREERRSMRLWSQGKASEALQDIALRQSCVTCHEVSETANDGLPGVEMASVNVPDRFYDAARFDHRAHRTQACTTCHAAESSTKAEDHLLPEAQDCTTCHGASPNPQSRLTQCSVCHVYHGTHAQGTEP